MSRRIAGGFESVLDPIGYAPSIWRVGQGPDRRRRHRGAGAAWRAETRRFRRGNEQFTGIVTRYDVLHQVAGIR